MRLQFQKMKSNPFSTLKERKNKNHNKSQEYEMVGTLGQVESNQI